MREKLTIFLLIAIGVSVSFGIPANNWHSYLSYYQTIAVAKSDQKIFAANKNGLFSFDLSGNNFETWSRVEGLSDAGISAISWLDSKAALVIGYSNGNLDLLAGNAILNLPDIKLKTSIVNKSINNIFFEGDFMWLSCDFGIVKINLKKWEVAETWVIGQDAHSIEVMDLAADGRYFWAATSSGIFRAEKSNPNLQDYHNWILQDQLPFSRDPFNSITVLNKEVYTCDRTGRIYRFDGLSWQSVYPGITGVLKIRSSASTLFVICGNSIELIIAGVRHTISEYGSFLPASAKINPSDVLIGNAGELWIGDHQFGLIRKTTDGNCQSIVPPCPANNNSRSLMTLGTNLYVATGKSDAEAASVPAEIHRLKDHSWNSVNEYSDSGLSGIKNITRVVPSPAHPEHYWGSTSGDGLIEFEGNKAVKNYKSNNSSLESQNETCKIGGLTYDAAGNLWVTNPSGRNQVHVIKPDGTWKSLTYPGIDNQFTKAGDVIVSKTDTKWIVVNNSDLFALRTGSAPGNTATDIYRKTSVRSRFSNGESTVLRGFNEVNALSEDHDGYLWVGTENGIVLYTNPDALLGNNEFYGVQPSVDLGDGIFHPVLENEKVNAIAIDGGNRKWFGTSNSGAFLFSGDGSKLICHFNTDNSPLFSNNITSIAINGENGEVFFATDDGLISWMGDATQGNNSFQHLYAWPNPVRETYHGDITIDGLSEKSNVKITDVTGNLVYKTISNGGRATWNGKNRGGVRVSTGVYLIFCSDSDGRQSQVIKLLFIR